MGALPNPVVRALARGLERAVYARSTSLVALSPGIQAALPAGKSALVPNAADLDLFDPAPHGGPFQVSYFGAMGEANDLTAAVEAAGLLADVSFVLMGDGKRRAELERSAPPNVRFRSGSKADVARLAAESSACLTLFKDVPVLATNSPNKLFDTFAAGRPAIVNMDGWMRELVERNDAGVYVRAGDATELAEKIAWLRDNPDRAEEMGRNGRALAEREFGRDELAARALAVLEEATR
jgi:glycosyltransferase involved in cell wall biosynthesis